MVVDPTQDFIKPQVMPPQATRRPGILWGDWFSAETIGPPDVGDFDEDGHELIRFRVKPIPMMIRAYNLKYGRELDAYGTMIIEHLRSQCFQPNAFDWFCLRDFKNRPTVFTRIYPTVELLQQYQRENQILRDINARNQRMNREMLNNIEYFAKRAAKVISYLKRKSEDDDDDSESNKGGK